MIGWLAFGAYSAGFVATFAVMRTHEEAEFGKPKDFMDWFGYVFVASTAALIWPIFALAYGAYRFSHRSAA